MPDNATTLEVIETTEQSEPKQVKTKAPKKAKVTPKKAIAKDPADYYTEDPIKLTPKERLELIRFFQSNIESYQAHNQALQRASNDAFKRYAELEEKYQRLQNKLVVILQNVNILHQNTTLIFKED